MNNKQLDVLRVEVLLAEFSERTGCEILCGQAGGNVCLRTENVSRPGLLLAGADEYFVAERVQVLGNAENHLLNRLDGSAAHAAVNRLLSQKPPCVIFANGARPDAHFLACASGYGVPVLATDRSTSDLIRVLSDYLNKVLAEMVSLHGVLVEVAGVGVLITGESAIGKSETALELVHRGHKLIADDAVIAQKIGGRIVGTAPDKIKFFMEVRGIGIIDVRELFGIGSVLNESNIDLVVKLDPFVGAVETQTAIQTGFDGVAVKPETRHARGGDVDRILLKPQFENILGILIPKHVIPVMVGRNLAIVIEVAARNHSLKSMGIDATKKLLAKQSFTN